MRVLSRFSDKFGSFHLGLGLFLFTDTQIAFQSMFLYGIGELIIEFLKVIYFGSRPYWDSSEVAVYRRECVLDFSMPSTIEFSIMFYWVYLLIQFYKVGYLSQAWASILGFIWLFLSVIIKLARLLFGTQYLFQIVITDLYAITYLVLCLTFEKDIVWFTESLGFDLIKSRELKFRVMFWLIGVFIINILCAIRENEPRSNLIIWLINLNSKIPQCD